MPLEDEAFEEIRNSIDKAIESDPSGRVGIAMSFPLAGEFLRRGLLTVVKFTLLIDWESRTYRDRHVYPDPWMADFQYRLGPSQI